MEGWKRALPIFQSSIRAGFLLSITKRVKRFLKHALPRVIFPTLVDDARVCWLPHIPIAAGLPKETVSDTVHRVEYNSS